MFENVLIKIGILEPTAEQMMQLTTFIADAEQQLRLYLNAPVLPSELNWVCEDIAIKRFRLVGSEHLTSESLDGVSFSYGDVLEPYKTTLDRYANSNSRRLKVL